MQKFKRMPQISRTHKPEHLTLEQWQVTLRREFGQIQNFRLKNIGQHPVFSEFIVTNPATERSYRVAIRSERLGDNFCSCPDFSVNTLGTCKHIEWTLGRLRNKPGGNKVLSEGFSPPFSEVFLRYGTQHKVVFSAGTESPVSLKEMAAKYFDKDNITEDLEIAYRIHKSGFKIRNWAAFFATISSASFIVLIDSSAASGIFILYKLSSEPIF